MDTKYIRKSQGFLDMINSGEYLNETKEYVDLLSDKYGDHSNLFSRARKTRDKTIGKKIFVRASVEFSNICSKSCKYCGMSYDNKELDRYKMTEDELKTVVYQIREHNIKQLHLVSGESNTYEIDTIGRVVEFAKKLGINSTVVLGNKKIEDYNKLLQYGASRYIMKFETSNTTAYKIAKGDDSLIERIANLLLLRDLGFKIGTGIIVGLPNTNVMDLARDILVLKNINPDMASCSVFSPNQQSKYKDYAPGDPDVTLKFIALMRILLDKKKTLIPSSSSFGFEGQVKAINAGANILSVHFTPQIYSDKFSMYKSKDRINRKLDEINTIANKTNMVVSDYE